MLLAVAGVLLALTLAWTLHLRIQLRRERAGLEGEVRARTAALMRANAELDAREVELRAQQRVLAQQQALLAQRSLELEHANARKTQLLASISHELRTPLNSVIGFADLLLDPTMGALTPRQARFVEDILASGRHLLLLVNDILDLMRIEAGHVTLQPSALPPDRAVMQALVLVGPEAAKRGITVRSTIGPLPAVKADPAKLLQVLLNLLVNAIKFSPAATEVVVGAEVAGAFVRFHVRDQGPGISSELRPYLFTPFAQGEDPFTRHHTGTGLGLAICRHLVTLHKGTLDVESVPGQGAEFWFTLPIADVPADESGGVAKHEPFAQEPQA